MDTFVRVTLQCAPWVAFSVSTLFLCFWVFDFQVDATFKKRQARLLAQMSPSYREMAERELAKRPMPPSHRGQLLILSGVAFAAGLALLAFR